MSTDQSIRGYKDWHVYSVAIPKIDSNIRRPNWQNEIKAVMNEARNPRFQPLAHKLQMWDLLHSKNVFSKVCYSQVRMSAIIRIISGEVWLIEVQRQLLQSSCGYPLDEIGSFVIHVKSITFEWLCDQVSPETDMPNKRTFDWWNTDCYIRHPNIHFHFQLNSRWLGIVIPVDKM